MSNDKNELLKEGEMITSKFQSYYKHLFYSNNYQIIPP